MTYKNADTDVKAFDTTCLVIERDSRREGAAGCAGTSSAAAQTSATVAVPEIGTSGTPDAAPVSRRDLDVDRSGLPPRAKFSKRQWPSLQTAVSELVEADCTETGSLVTSTCTTVFSPSLSPHTRI